MSDHEALHKNHHDAVKEDMVPFFELKGETDSDEEEQKPTELPLSYEDGKLIFTMNPEDKAALDEANLEASENYASNPAGADDFEEPFEQ